MAVAFALSYNPAHIPPGDMGIVAFISVNKQEASNRLRTIKAILDALKIKWKPTTDGVELDGRPITFQSFACTVGAVSGFTSILVIADEVSKWADKESNTNPATEVLAAVRPTMATQRAGRIVLSSSPLGFNDAHAVAFEQGNTDHQEVAKAESWVANPTITEAQTRMDEPHEPTWRREYAAVPTGGASGAFSPADIDAAIRPISTLSPIGRPTQLFDSSAGSGDSWTWCSGVWCRPFDFDPSDEWLWEDVGDTYKPGLIALHGGRLMRQLVDETGTPILNPKFREQTKPALALFNLQAISGRFRDSMTAEDIVVRMANDAKRAGARKCVGDQYQSFFLESACKKQGVQFHQVNWSNTSKIAAIATLRRWMQSRVIAVEPGDEAEALRNELLGFEERISPSGILTFGARRGGHDDRVALLINAAMAETQLLLDGSPNGRSNTRHELFDYEQRDDE